MRRPKDVQKIDIYLPLFVGDYLASTSHLTAVEHGAYLLLLMHQWKNGYLPSEEEMLRRIGRVEKDAWSTTYALLKPFFRIADDGRIFQARLEEEREKCIDIRKSRSDHGKRAANSRWHSQNDAPAMLEHSPRSAPAVTGDAIQTQIQIQTHIKEKDKNPLTDSPESSSVIGHVTPSTPEEFIYSEYPRKEGRRAAIKQIELAVVRMQRGESPLEPLSKGDAQKLLFKRVRAYAQSPAGQNPDKSKIPHPKTWFGQSRYLDDSANWQIVTDNGGSIAIQRSHRSKTDGNIDAARRAIAELTGIDPYGSSAGAPSAYQLGNAQAIRPEVIPPGSTGCEGGDWNDSIGATA